MKVGGRERGGCGEGDEFDLILTDERDQRKNTNQTGEFSNRFPSVYRSLRCFYRIELASLYF